MTKPKANPKPSPWKKGIFLLGTWRCQCGTLNASVVKACQKCLTKRNPDREKQ